MKEYYYLIAFSVMRGCSLSFRSAEAHAPKPITHMEDLLEITEGLQQAYPGAEITIINFTFLRGEDNINGQQEITH